MSTLYHLDAFKFGPFDEGILVRVGYIGADDMFRTQKSEEYIINSLYYRYGISRQQVYVIFENVDRHNVYLGGVSM